MSIQLVIAEKPSVARSIAGVIGADQKRDGYMEGNGYLVSWCIGTLFPLPTPEPMTSVSRSGAMTTCRFCHRNGSTSSAEKKGPFAVLRSLMERPT